MPSVTALIQFDQGGPGTPGQAFVGSTGSLVTVTNDDNTNVNSWQIDLVYTPPGSAVPVAIPLAFNDANNTPTATFTPDVRGSYRLVTTVWAVINRTGNNYDVDIRNFIILLSNGLVLPPYQKDPDKLPTLASGRPGAKPNETNINGSEFGWAGDGTDGLLAQAITMISDGIVITPATITADQNDYTPTQWGIANIARLSSDALRNITGFAAVSPGVTRKLLVNAGANPIVLKNEDLGSSIANRIHVPGGVDVTLAADETANIWYDVVTTRWRVV